MPHSKLDTAGGIQGWGVWWEGCRVRGEWRENGVPTDLQLDILLVWLCFSHYHYCSATLLPTSRSDELWALPSSLLLGLPLVQSLYYIAATNVSEFECTQLSPLTEGWWVRGWGNWTARILRQNYVHFLSNITSQTEIGRQNKKKHSVFHLHTILIPFAQWRSISSV